MPRDKELVLISKPPSGVLVFWAQYFHDTENLGASMLGYGTSQEGETPQWALQFIKTLCPLSVPESSLSYPTWLSTRLQCLPRTLVILGMEPGVGGHSFRAWWSHLPLVCAQVENHALLSTLQLLYTVGYSLSVVSLLLALTILLFLR